MGSDYNGSSLVEELKMHITTLFDGSPEKKEQTKTRIVEILETGWKPVAGYIFGRIHGRMARELMRELLITAIASGKNEKLQIYCGSVMRDRDLEFAKNALDMLFMVGNEKTMTTLLDKLTTDRKVIHVEKLRERLIELIIETNNRIEVNGIEAESSAVRCLSTLGYIVAISLVDPEEMEFKKRILGMKVGSWKYAGAVEALMTARVEERSVIEEFLMSEPPKIVTFQLLDAIRPARNTTVIKELLKKMDHETVIKKAIGIIPHTNNLQVMSKIGEFVLELIGLNERNAITAAKAIFRARAGGKNINEFDRIINEIDPILQIKATVILIGNNDPEKVLCGMENLGLLVEQDPNLVATVFREALDRKLILGKDHTQTIRKISETEGPVGEIAKRVMQTGKQELTKKHNAFVSRLKKVGAAIAAPFRKATSG
jgi:hypothetical protein